VTGYGNRWTRERVTSLRSHHRIAVYKPADDGIEPVAELSKAAAASPCRAPERSGWQQKPVRSRRFIPCRTGPGSYSRAVLSASPARAITERARQNPKYPAGSHPDRQSLFSSSIDRWVFRCAVVAVDEIVELGCC